MGQSWESLPLLERREIVAGSKEEAEVIALGEAAKHIAAHRSEGDPYTAHAFRKTLGALSPAARMVDAALSRTTRGYAVLPDGDDLEGFGPDGGFPSRAIDHGETPGDVPLREATGDTTSTVNVGPVS